LDGQPVPIRAVRLGRFSASAQTQGDGSVRVRSTLALGPYPRSIVDALEQWAQRTPDAVLIADRDNDGWRKLSFADVVERIQPLAQALARHYRGRGIDDEDLEQVATLGLCKAVRGYRHQPGKTFAAYAMPPVGTRVRSSRSAMSRA